MFVTSTRAVEGKHAQAYGMHRIRLMACDDEPEGNHIYRFRYGPAANRLELLSSICMALYYNSGDLGSR